jgi:DNA-directed RNA polymerase specialized sigma24 family protein
VPADDTGLTLETLLALEPLSLNQREALIGHVVLRLTFAVLAVQMGLSLPRVAQLEAEALVVLRRTLERP